jgi:hypothetical protein
MRNPAARQKPCDGSGRSMWGDIVVGISMLDHILSEVRALHLSGEKEIGDALLKQVKIYNYVPASAEEKYRIALLREYRNFRSG